MKRDLEQKNPPTQDWFVNIFLRLLKVPLVLAQNNHSKLLRNT